MAFFNTSGRSETPVTTNLIIINCIFLAATFVLGRIGVNLENYLALHYYDSHLFNPMQMFTYMFMHADISHLFFNMFSLYFIGRGIEYFWGPGRYLIYYLVCGVGAAIVQQIAWRWGMHDAMAQALASINPTASFETINAMSYNELLAYCENYVDFYRTVGASGCVFGILLAFGMMFPEQPVYLYFIMPIKAKYFVWGYGLIELFAGVRNSAGDNVAHFAHLGGMLFGLLLILYWRKAHRHEL